MSEQLRDQSLPATQAGALAVLSEIVEAAWTGHDPEMSSGNFNRAILNAHRLLRRTPPQRLVRTVEYVFGRERHEYHNGQGPGFAHLPCRECGRLAGDPIHA